MKHEFSTPRTHLLTRFLVTGLAFAVSATASAGSINYDFRADYSHLDFTSDAIPSSSRMYLKTGRIDFKGTLNDALTYEARWAMNKPAVGNVPPPVAPATTSSPANNARDGVNNSVELAFITHKMSDMFALSIGKFNTDIGGFEGATSGADLYLISPIYQHSAVTTALGTGAKNIGILPDLLYMTGVKGVIALGETQSLSLVATNNTADSTTNGLQAQNRGLLGATYKGAFVDKTLIALLSYHEVSPQDNTVFHNKHTFIAASVKYDAQPLAAILEYQTTTFNDDATGRKDMLNAVIAKVGYNIDQWTPRLEAFTSEEKLEVAGTQTNHYNGVGAVLEWKPTADNFRYHVAYNAITAQPGTGSDVTRSEIVVGARLFGDFLK